VCHIRTGTKKSGFYARQSKYCCTKSKIFPFTEGGIMKNWVKTIVIFILILILNACAFDLAHVKQIPTQIESTQLSKSSFELLDEVNISLYGGYSRKLKKGTIWHYVGTISYGDIFKTDDQILTVEASNIYEAYIVISSSKIVGFYLPVEKSFSPVNDPEELKIREVNHVQ
jgi:hypothetical protein